jgi:Fe-S-cluster-containing dehydrogenase component
MSQLAMVIDMHKCTGCGACGLACKTENNTRDAGKNEDFKWANFFTVTKGEFPDVEWTAFPTLCNHCSDAPCIEICPTNPKAMYKGPDGITLHNDELCIGCQLCAYDCPYSERDYTANKAQYTVISYNKNDPQPFYNDTTAIIMNCTSSPKEVADEYGTIPPFKNDYPNEVYFAVRPKNVTEKCIFCYHRVKEGDKPYCVVSCPANARIFGDINDPNSEVSRLVANNEHVNLKNNKGEFLENGEEGTKPNVFYINSFQTQNITSVKEKQTIEKISLLKVYPNPIQYNATIEFDLKRDSFVTLNIYDITGKLILSIYNNESLNYGKHVFNLNAAILQQGTYICALQTAYHTETVNLVVAR